VGSGNQFTLSVIGHFSVKKVVQEAAKAFVAAGYGAAADFRIRRPKGPLD
jgi:hypothetical protein